MLDLESYICHSFLTTPLKKTPKKKKTATDKMVKHINVNFESIQHLSIFACYVIIWHQALGNICEQGKHSSCSFLQSFYFRKREKHKKTNINSLVVIMIHATKAKEKVVRKRLSWGHDPGQRIRESFLKELVCVLNLEG